MKTYTECVPCFVQQAHDALKLFADDELVHETLQKVLREVALFPLECTPPKMAQLTHRIIREATGNADPYATIKTQSTTFALKLAEEAQHIITGSIDPFKMALRFSIAGNILDFALVANWNRLNLDDFIEKTRLHSLEDKSVELLRAAVQDASTILVLADNAGETVFDRLLIEQIADKKMAYAVKSSPIINDATRADACEAGIDQVAELIENGSDAPGTILEECSDAFRKRFFEADLVIAKGQANYESLSEATRPLFFLTQVKCPVIGRDLDEPVGSWIIRKHKGINK